MLNKKITNKLKITYWTKPNEGVSEYKAILKEKDKNLNRDEITKTIEDFDNTREFTINDYTVLNCNRECENDNCEDSQWRVISLDQRLSHRTGYEIFESMIDLIENNEWDKTHLLGDILNWEEETFKLKDGSILYAGEVKDHEWDDVEPFEHYTIKLVRIK